MPIPYSKIVVRVGESALDVCILNRKDPKRLGALWKEGDGIWCLKHQWNGCDIPMYEPLVLLAQNHVSHFPQCPNSFWVFPIQFMYIQSTLPYPHYNFRVWDRY